MSRSNDADGFARGHGAWRDVFADAFDLNAAAERLGVSTATVDEMVHRGELVAVRLGGAWLLPARQFDADGVLPGVSRVLESWPGSTVSLSMWACLPPGNCTAARLPRRSRIPRRTDDAKVRPGVRPSTSTGERMIADVADAVSSAPLAPFSVHVRHVDSTAYVGVVGELDILDRPRTAAGARRGDRTRRRPSRSRSARRRVPRLVRHRDRGAPRPTRQGPWLPRRVRSRQATRPAHPGDGRAHREHRVARVAGGRRSPEVAVPSVPRAETWRHPGPGPQLAQARPRGTVSGPIAIRFRRDPGGLCARLSPNLSPSPADRVHLSSRREGGDGRVGAYGGLAGPGSEQGYALICSVFDVPSTMLGAPVPQ